MAVTMDIPPEYRCEYGIPVTWFREALSPEEFDALLAWQAGATGAICTGERYDHALGANIDTGCGPHGLVFYRHNIERFLKKGK